MAQLIYRSVGQVISNGKNLRCWVMQPSRFLMGMSSSQTSSLRNAQSSDSFILSCRDELPIAKGDPAPNRNLFYNDPTLLYQTFEKLEPFKTFIVDCPTILPNKVINEGNKTTPTPLQTLPNILVIRKKKMKKHQRTVFKKLNYIKWQGVRLRRQKEKEKKIVSYEQKMAKWAKEFDAEQDLNEMLKKARDAGWGIDILAQKASKKQNPKL